MARHPSRSRQESGQSSRERPNQSRRAEDAGDDKGLCPNCANREDCLLPKSEGGVWHCEEFVEAR